jgi:hypothetical protein
MSDESDHSDAEGPSEAELALKKRRAGPDLAASKGLDEAARELLATNKQDRDRMEQEILELKKRNEKRKKLREEEEKRLAAEREAEDQKRKAAENAKLKLKEEEETKRQKERAKKQAEFAKYQNAAKPNFVISKRSGSAGDEEEVTESTGGKKSREQLETEKRAILKQRIVPLQIDGLDQSGLASKAKELHKLIYRLEGEKYDLEKRFKSQQIDMMELAEKARQANKVGKDGLKRAQIGDGESDKIQERFAGTPAKVQMFSKYERQKDMRLYSDRKTLYTGPQYILPPERIKASKIVKWNEAGMPTYEEMAEGGGAEPAAHTEE